MFFSLFLFKDFIYLFLEKGEGREKERERNINVCCLLCGPHRGPAHNPGMYPNWESKWWPFGSQPMLSPLSYTSQGSLSFLKYFIYLLLERAEGREIGGETSMCDCLSCTTYWGPGQHPGVCPDWETNQQHFGLQPALNPLSHTSQVFIILMYFFPIFFLIISFLWNWEHQVYRI